MKASAMFGRSSPTLAREMSVRAATGCVYRYAMRDGSGQRAMN